MKNLYILFFISIISITSYSQSPNFEWVKQIEGTSFSTPNESVIDIYDNILTIGNFSDTVDIDPNVGVTNLGAKGGSDIFIQKLDVNGNLLWAKSIGGTGMEYSYAVDTDVNGNIYCTGLFENTIDVDPGIGVTNITSSGDKDIFILKLDANGGFLWVKHIGGSGYENIVSIKIDGGGNVYSTGVFQSVVDFDPGSGVVNFTAVSGSDIYIQKLDSNGNFIFAKQIEGSFEAATEIMLDEINNVYLTGWFANVADFDPGPGVVNLVSAGSYDIFIQKLDSNGNLLWVKQMGGTGDDGGTAIKYDVNGNIYTTGWFEATVDFDPGSGQTNLTSTGGHDVFIQKLDSSGNFIWVKQIEGINEIKGWNIVVDANSNIYTTGSFTGVVDFDPGTGTSNYTSNGGSDIYIQKLDINGNFLWIQQMGGTGNDVGHTISINSNGDLYNSGIFNSVVDFDPGSGVSNLTSIGGEDCYLQKLSQPAVGITGNSFNNEFQLYPNPTSSQLNINTDNLTINNISILNIAGQLVKTMKNEVNTIDVASLPAGIYFLELKTDEKSIIKKFVKY